MIGRLFLAISIAIVLHIIAGLFLGPGAGPLPESFFTEFGFILTAAVAFTELTFLAQ